MRLFYAIALPHSVKDALLHITGQLRQYIHSEHWAHRDNYHLTLGREVTTPEGFSPEGLAQSLTVMEIPVNALSLMESVRIDGKLVYREIARQSASTFH